MSGVSQDRAKLPAEQEAIRAQCFHPSGIFTEFKSEEIEQSISARFEQQVVRYPERLALQAKGCSYTYGALNRAANRIADAILTRRGSMQETIASLLSNGPALPTAMLGVFKAGKIFVFLNPTFPQARLSFMLENAQAALLVTDNEHLSLAKELARNELQLINLDELDSSHSSSNPAIPLSPDALAWISYTSGSTGQPKGVVQNHRNLLHLFMTQTNDLHICSEDRISTFTSVAGEVLLAVLNGAASFPVNIKKDGLAGIGEWLLQKEITVYNSVPSIFRHLANTLRGDEKFSKLRLLRFTGEPLHRSDVDLYRRYFPQSCILVNRLSSNEVPAFRQYFINHSTAITDPVVPVGYAIRDYEVLLMSEGGGELGVDEIGEVAVKSRHLSPGYWRNPDLTRSKFLPAPEEEDKRIFRTGDLGCLRSDGCLVYLGRKDFQVKIRGNRVELAEVERALASLDLFKETVVVPLADHRGEQRLVAYLVPRNPTAVSSSALRRYLSDKLPEYMIPSSFVLLDSLPLTNAGKVDRSALPPPAQIRPELETPFAPPQNPTDATVAAIWAEVLGLDRVGIEDKFLDLGGNSLLAVQIISRVFNTFQVEVPLPLFFAAPTVAEMAALIDQHGGKNLTERDLARILDELDSLTESEAKRLIKERVSEEQKN